MTPADVLALAHDLPDAAIFERVTLDTLAARLGGDAAFFATPAEPPTTLVIDAAALGSAIVDGRYDDELAPLKAHAFANGGVVVDTAALGEQRVMRTRYHRELARPVRGRHSLLGLATLRGRPVASVMLGRAGSTFEAAEVSRLRELLPALALARASYGVSHVPRALGTRGERLVRAGELVVRDRGGYREMVSAGPGGDFVWSRARRDAPDVSGWPYTDLLLLAAVRARRLSRALLVGAGGGVLAHGLARLRPGVAIDVVEPDARVVELARAHFGLDAVPRCRVHLDSGLPFLERAEERTWDAILVDAYDGAELPRDFASPRLFRALRRALRHGGVASMNVVDALTGGPLRDVVAAAEAHLEKVAIVPVVAHGERAYPTSRRNVIVLGSRSEIS